MRANVLGLAFVALTLAAATVSAGETCKSDNGSFVAKHSFTQGQCEAQSDGSGGKAISHGNGQMSNGYASSQGLGVAKATAGAHSAATAYASGGIGTAISDPRGFSMVNASGGNAKAVSSSGGNAQAFTSPGDVAYASATHNATSAAYANGSTNGVATAISDTSGNATADASAGCNAKATANSKGQASASCGVCGSDVTAEATGGATAEGSDTAPPVCDTSTGGTAKVTSPMGNCSVQ